MYQVFGKWVKRSAVGIMLLSGIAAASFAVSAAQTEETEKLLTKVDPTKGITYIYQEEGGTIAGINLNGNSVIIKMGQKLDADGKLVDSSSFNQIYIDKNRNGVVDGDETPAVICDEMAEPGKQESVNVVAGPTIYGIYKQSSDTPIRITIDGGFAPVVYGVYEGEMTVKGETAVTMEAVSGSVSGTLYGEYGSKLTVEDATAVSVDYRIPVENTLSMCAAAYNGSVTVTGTETALKINVADGAIDTLMGGCGITLDAEATAVQMDIAGTIKTGLHGLSSCQRVQAGDYGAMVYLKDKAVIQGVAFVLYDSKVETGKSAGVLELASGANVTATFFGANGGTAATKTAGCPVIDVKIEGGASEPNSLNQLCGACNSKVTAAGKEEEAVRIVQTGGLTNIYNLTGAASGSHILGNVLVDLKGTIVNPASFYGVSNGTEVDGDVTMRMERTSGTSYFTQYGTSCYSAGFGSSAPCSITGNVSIVNGEDVDINSLYGMQGSTVQGNVTVDTYGRNAGNSYGGTIAGAYDSNGDTDMGVKGDISLKYRGGGM